MYFSLLNIISPGIKTVSLLSAYYLLEYESDDESCVLTSYKTIAYSTPENSCYYS